MSALAFEIYCRVVDNLGDAGVCWRLARQLAREFGARVTLRIDAPATLASIAPGIRVGEAFDGVLIEPWTHAPLEPRTVVVSAFGCELPGPLRRALAAAHGVLWVNLEYLSAEAWIDGCHGLASPKPDDLVVEHFFYPGFTARSGGLLRERGLIEARDAFRRADGPLRWLRSRGFDARAGERRISLFCYPDAPVEQWLALLAADRRPTQLLVPEGVAAPAIEAFLGQALAPGARAQRGALRLECFELLAQDDYDRLLWSCSLNFVRGEDSWVRAIWAGTPFVWQPYRQDEDAHTVKLGAFLDRFSDAARRVRAPGAPPVPAPIARPPEPGAMPDAAPRFEGPTQAAAALMHAWNSARGLPPAWAGYLDAFDDIAAAHAAWTAALSRESDLASRLVSFCDSRL